MKYRDSHGEIEAFKIKRVNPKLHLDGGVLLTLFTDSADREEVTEFRATRTMLRRFNAAGGVGLIEGDYLCIENGTPFLLKKSTFLSRYSTVCS